MLLSLLLHFYSFSKRNQLTSHLGLVRSYPTSISVADNDFNTFPNGAAHHMFHTIHPSPTVFPGQAEGRNPTNRTMCLDKKEHTRHHKVSFSHSALKPKEISTYNKSSRSPAVIHQAGNTQNCKFNPK